MKGIWREAAGGREYPRCPVCGEETDTLYQDGMGDIVGCERCLEQIDAWERQERGR